MSSNAAPVKNWKLTILLLALIWGCVGLQRNATAFMGPQLSEAFGVDLLSIGWLGSVLAVAWGIGSLTAGRLADKHGVKPMLLIFGGATAMLGWISGLAATIGALIAIRAFLGLAEGGVLSPIMNGARRSAPVHLKAVSVSIIFASFIIIGMVAGPIIMTEVEAAYGWQAGFYIAAVPTAILLVLLYFVMQEPPVDEYEISSAKEKPAPILQTFMKKNVLVGAILSVASFARVYILMIYGFFLLGSDVDRGGYFMLEANLIPITVSIFLLADALGGLTMNKIADKTGHRKRIVMIALALVIVFGAIFAMLPADSPYALVLATLVAFNFCGGAVSPLAVGIIPSETVAPKDAVTATGCSNATGEILGGGALALLAAVIAQSYGLHIAMWIPVVVAMLALMVASKMDDIRAGGKLAE